MSSHPPIDRYCKKCMSNRVYVDGDFLACRTCGNRWNPNLKPITKIQEDEEMPAKINLDVDQLKSLVDGGKSFPTIMKEMNCTRSTLSRTLAALGLKAADGRAERYHKPQTQKLSPAKIKEVKTHVKALAIKHNGGDPNSAGIIAVIDMKIIYHQDMIDKLKQAKQILIK